MLKETEGLGITLWLLFFHQRENTKGAGKGLSICLSSHGLNIP